MSQQPTIGRIVHYKLSQNDTISINRRRVYYVGNPMPENWPEGAQAHVGHQAEIGQVVPLIVVVVWPNADGFNVNGQAFLDGNDTLWVSGAKEGLGPGQWPWPQRS